PSQTREVQPQLVVLATCDDMGAPSSRHVLRDVDEVRFGRGPRGATREVSDGKRILRLSFPDQRASTEHGSLTRGPVGWVLDEPTSKNGTVVDGVLTRRMMLATSAVIEVGRTFLWFWSSVLEDGAPDDLLEGALATPALATFVGPLADKLAALRAL